MELISKLESNDTSKIGIIPSVSKDFFAKFADQCIQIINNKNMLNWLKGSKQFKRDINDSNINHAFTMFKGKIMLITDLWTCDWTKNCLHC